MMAQARTFAAIATIEESYVRNAKALREILHSVHQGYYCTVLGPRYCQKGLLLHDVKAELEADSDGICILIDLQTFDQVADHEFLQIFALRFAEQVQSHVQISDPPVPDEITDKRALQSFLQRYVQLLACDVVLLINHLEYIRLESLKALLLTLRAIYVEREPHTPYRLGVVTASSLMVADLSLGENSPFNIARPVWIRDLDAEGSVQLIAAILHRYQVDITTDAEQRVVHATNGDRSLIALLCQHCAVLASTVPQGVITVENVETVIEWFHTNKAEHYAPFRETVRSLEEHPPNLLNVVQILQAGSSPRRLLNLPLHSGVDALQLTGAVRVETQGEEQIYFIRNEIYAAYLKKHFQPARVVRILTLAGYWEAAIGYLEALVIDEPTHRTRLLGVLIESIYVANNQETACDHLCRVVTHAFALKGVRLYLVTPTRATLRRVSHFGFRYEPPETIELTATNQPEVQALSERHYKVVNQSWGQQVVYFPLLNDTDIPLGVVAIHGFLADPQHDDFLEMRTFWGRVSRAISIVSDRERTLNQFEVLQKTGKRLTSSLDLPEVLQETVAAAMEAVPAAQSGILFLWDDQQQLLRMCAQQGYPAHIGDHAIFRRGEGYTGWVFDQRQPLLLPSVFDDPRAKHFSDPTLNYPKSALSVPLEAWGRVIGVLNLENSSTLNAFQQTDLDLLSTFGSQAAIAIQNASLYTELYTLGMAINRGQLTPEQIFQATVKSITRVSDTKAANLLLLRDTDDPLLSISQSPLLSVSIGLSEDYDEQVKPRLAGLTALVLTKRKPHAVSHPDEAPGINPLAQQQGIRACLCLPLMIQDNIIGILFVHYARPHNFSDNEIHMLSLFANQAALAIENARQREDLQLSEAVVWSGIAISTLAHSITQKIGAIDNVVWGLRKMLQNMQPALERLERIAESVRIAKEILSKARTGFSHKVTLLDLNTTLVEQIPQWLPSTEGILFDASGLTKEPLWVYADPNWLNFVLEILLNNASRAMRSAVQKQLIVTSSLRNGHVVVEISNNGEAIPAEIQTQLFKKRITKVMGNESSGIGLLHARVIMRRYKGDVELVTSDAAWTKFALRLPLARLDAPQQAFTEGK